MSMIAGQPTLRTGYRKLQLLCVSTVLIVHLLVAAYFIMSPAVAITQTTHAAMPDAVVISMVAAPKVPKNALPEGPEQQMASQSSAESKPKPKPKEQPKLEQPELIAKQSEIKITKPNVTKKTKVAKVEKVQETAVDDTKPVKEKVEQTEQNSQNDREVAQTTAPKSIDAAPAEQRTGPVSNAFSKQQAEAKQRWQMQLSAHLERRKRYPRMAKLKRQQGVPWVKFTMDREGQVIAVSLFRASGVSSLDKEVLALVKRAEPLPLPPDEITGTTLTLTLPVEFFIN
ncbi:hypothetical protein NCCP2140_18350 [Pseudoalteromonas sp. NCCP-2140]|uniref:TonB family protein n=1 Tax=Pseudoalteromonas sp. NCCP-2140 TaxID=2942288 RepID=UPI0020420D6F|nr:TonB family protein [Pseudoalteromonas sp. NCCP-2140]GKW52782.1 hypothetical protein NCCP2140_18350 [Pseudoalteromonas sp. NCCP-2140]